MEVGRRHRIAQVWHSLAVARPDGTASLRGQETRVTAEKRWRGMLPTLEQFGTEMAGPYVQLGGSM